MDEQATLPGLGPVPGENGKAKPRAVITSVSGGSRLKGLVGDSLVNSLSGALLAFDASKEVVASRGMQYFRVASWAYAAISQIAQDVGCLPFLITAANDDANVAIKTGPLYDLLQAPNTIMDAMELREVTMIHLLTSGNAYWVMDTLTGEFPGKVRELWPLPPDQVRPIPDRVDVIGGYLYRPSGTGKAVILPRESVVHFRLPDATDVMRGFSPMVPLDTAIRSLLAAMMWNRKFFENDATPGSVNVEIPETVSLDRDEYERLRAGLKEIFARDLNRAFEPLILEAGAKLNSFAHTHKEMGFERLIGLDRETVLAVLKTPPAIAGVFAGLNLAQVEMQERRYWRWTIMPHTRRIGGRMDRQLVPVVQPGLTVGFDTSAIEVLQPDANAALERKTKRIMFGLESPNEVLEAEGRDTYEGGDTHFISASLRPVGSYVPPSTPLPPPPNRANENAARVVEVKASIKALTNAEARDAFNRDLMVAQLEVNREWQAVVRFFMGDVENKLALDPPPELQNGRITIAALHGPGVRIKAKGDEIERVGLPLPAESYMPNPDELNEFIEARMMPAYDKVRSKFGTRAVERIIGDFRFNANTEPVMVLRDAQRARLKRIGDTVLDDAARVLEQGFEVGQSFDGMVRQVGDTVGSIERAERIVRTETTASANGGKFDAFKQAGFERWGWLTSGLGNVRASHSAAAGQVVKIGEAFNVGGFPLKFAGDPDGPASEVVNCNCTNEPELSTGGDA